MGDSSEAAAGANGDYSAGTCEADTSASQKPRGAAVVDGLIDPSAAEEVVKDADEFRLATEFYDAYKKFTELLKSEGDRPEQSDLDDLSTKIKAIAFFVAKYRLFSPNEELEDIRTNDLKYLLVPYILAEVTAAQTDMEARLRALRHSIVFWQAFAADCERLKVADKGDLQAIDREPEARLDAATKREEKIDRYKRCKDLDEKIGYLFAKKKECFGDEFSWGTCGAFDEDMERDLVLALLRRAVASAADNLASAQQELPLLEMMMARGGPGAPPPARPPPAEKPFIMRIQDKAELMKIYKDMVFQCPHPLPTMTIEEAAEIEMAQMQERQDGEAERARQQQWEQDQRFWGGRYGTQEDDDDEKKTYKDRDWDDWKDEHPWGSGNKMANIG
eukprot:TRINITY_DN31092_c0_g1_i1.p1 TRINITY_DN31092_c0_g1~~TRINITY_DN31092_c0_g1_i1.p1  ORF type:complete len:390 (-),score=128.87 TRINITY_DN31092_c0_g1_i1:144-1313(-)